MGADASKGPLMSESLRAVEASMLSPVRHPSVITRAVISVLQAGGHAPTSGNRFAAQRSRFDFELTCCRLHLPVLMPEQDKFGYGSPSLFPFRYWRSPPWA